MMRPLPRTLFFTTQQAGVIKCESVLGRRVVLGLLVRGGVALQVLVPAGAAIAHGTEPR